MKIILNEKYAQLTNAQLAYIGIDAIRQFLGNKNESLKPIKFSVILTQIEIALNNIIQAIRKNEITGYDEELFQDERAIISHAKKGFLHLCKTQSSALYSYYEKILAPIYEDIKDKIEIPTFQIDTREEHLEIDIEQLYKHTKKFARDHSENFNFQGNLDIISEMLVGSYVLDKYPNSFEAQSFGRIIVQTIREKYIQQISSDPSCNIDEMQYDPFYKLLYVRNQYAHSKFCDLYGQDPAILMKKLREAIGISNKSYKAYHTTYVERQNTELEQDDKTLGHFDKENSVKSQKKLDTPSKKSHKTKVLSQKTSEEQKLPAFLEQDNAVSKALGEIFTYLVALLEKANDVDYTGLSFHKKGDLAYYEIKRMIAQDLLQKLKSMTSLTLGQTKEKELLKKIAVTSQEIIDSCGQFEEACNRVVNCDNFTPENKMKILNGSGKLRKIKENILSLKTNLMNIIQHELFDPHIPIVTYNTIGMEQGKFCTFSKIIKIGAIPISELNIYGNSLGKVIYHPAGLVARLPFDLKITKQLISKLDFSTIGQYVTMLLYTKDHQNLDIMLKLCKTNHIDLDFLLNSGLIQTVDSAEMKNLKTKLTSSINITPVTGLRNLTIYELENNFNDSYEVAAFNSWKDGIIKIWDTLTKYGACAGAKELKTYDILSHFVADENDQEISIIGALRQELCSD
jgi:hypothetical protein